MLGILQLSDIHFAFDGDSIFDLDRELRDGLIAFVPRLQERLGQIDLIVVTGDVAFGGSRSQYETAMGFLRDVRSVLQRPHMPVKVIPGNHDIQQEDTNNADQRGWRSGPRKSGLTADRRSQELAKLLQGPASGVGLLAPLAAYNEFAAAFDCAIEPLAPAWEYEMKVSDYWALRIRGLTSVLVSDAHDKIDRLVLGTLQTTGWKKEPQRINLTLCHHPYCWLLDGEEQRNRLCRRSHVHVTGHVHCHYLDESRTGHVHLGAGALQPPRDEPGQPRFNGLGLEVVGTPASPELVLTIVAVVWDADLDAFRFDEPNCKACRVALESYTGQAPGQPGNQPDSAAILRLTERFATLQLSDQIQVVAAIDLDVGSVLRRPAHEMVGAVIEHAEVSGRLSKLWDEVSVLHGNQSGELNPFLESGA